MGQSVWPPPPRQSGRNAKDGNLPTFTKCGLACFAILLCAPHFVVGLDVKFNLTNCRIPYRSFSGHRKEGVGSDVLLKCRSGEGGKNVSDFFFLVGGDPLTSLSSLGSRLRHVGLSLFLFRGLKNRVPPPPPPPPPTHPQKHISRPPVFSLPPSCLSLPRSPPQICVLTSQERGGKVILISDSCLISLFGRSYIARPIRSQDISGGMNYSPQSDWAFELNFWQSGGYICACGIVVIVFLSF